MTEHKVKIWTTPQCPWCHKTKEWLKEHDVTFEEINVVEDPKASEEMVEKSGQRGVPVLEIDGEIVVGFDEPKLKELLLA